MVSRAFSMAPVSEEGRSVASFHADSETQRHLKTKCHSPKCSGDEIDAPSHLPVSCHMSSVYGGGHAYLGEGKGGIDPPPHFPETQSVGAGFSHWAWQSALVNTGLHLQRHRARASSDGHTT